jgi:hypothetical protein
MKILAKFQSAAEALAQLAAQHYLGERYTLSSDPDPLMTRVMREALQSAYDDGRRMTPDPPQAKEFLPLKRRNNRK